MANTNALGTAIGGFMEAFTGSRQNKERREDEEKERKLTTQLFEMQLKKLQQSEEAFGRLDARVNAPTELQQGPSTFSPGGRELTQLESAPGESLAELLADPSVLLDANRAGVDFGSAPGGDIPSDIRALLAAGIDPEGPEGRQAILHSVGGRDDPTDKLLAQIQVQNQQFRLDDLRRDREKTERTEKQAIAGTKVAISSDFRHAKEIIELQKDLENTALSVGVPYGELLRDLQAGGAAIAGVAGFDVGEINKLLRKRDRLNKLFADGVIEGIDRFAGTGTMSIPKFNALMDASPSMDNQAGANALLLADRMQALLESAELSGIEVSQRAEIEEFISASRAAPTSVGRFIVEEQ